MAEPRVAIVGGGPVGLGLAIDLALRGVCSVVLERGTELHRIPKGQNLTQRTGELFRAWGVTEGIRAATPIPREYGNAGIVTYGKLLSDYSYDWFQRSKVGAYYHALNERLPQYRTEEVLRTRARELPQIEFRTGCKMVELRSSTEDVRLEVETETGSESLTFDYVIGCDGARSRVRDLAGITQDMDHQGPRMALLVFRSMELDRLLQCYPGKSIYNVMNPEKDGYWQFLGRFDMDGGWFYHSPIPAEAKGEDFFRQHLHDFVGTGFALEFEHIGFWDLRISHASNYRAGRVFIAGDAAHSHPPYGGYGVNTGFEDARNLSWKLAAHLQGWGSEVLLDSYSRERHPVFKSVARDFIQQTIEDFRRFHGRVFAGAGQGSFRSRLEKTRGSRRFRCDAIPAALCRLADCIWRRRGRPRVRRACTSSPRGPDIISPRRRMAATSGNAWAKDSPCSISPVTGQSISRQRRKRWAFLSTMPKFPRKPCRTLMARV